ncbi:MAG TPA: rod shape-determining protein RodA [Polyangiaceae bacterium]|jgi:rod shape determining protein RodA|nr:rod shape-determining protein RodA [Polyangiaceae bacterium]
MMMGNDYFRLRERFDWPLFISAALVAVIGIVNLYSATSVYSGARAEQYVNQVYWLVGGGILAVFAASVDYRHFERLGYVVYIVGVLCLVLVFILGRDIRGSARWIVLGSFQFQPSEFMKLALAIALAKFLHDDPRGEARTLKDLVVPVLLTVVPVYLIGRQPDLGTAIILMLIFFSIALLIRLRWRSVVGLAGIAAIIVPLAWNFGLKDYQRQRITSFLNPEADLRGAGWQAHHARVAIGNGGLFGQGYMRGTQNQFKFLPDQYSDFPFPVFAEDWGFLGGVLLLGLYGFISIWAIRVASQSKDRFGAALSVGIGAMIFWQAFINLGMVLGLLPVVGVTLPLFSSGGSSVLTVLIGVGLLMNVSMRRNYFAPVKRGDLLAR